MFIQALSSHVQSTGKSSANPLPKKVHNSRVDVKRTNVDSDVAGNITDEQAEDLSGRQKLQEERRKMDQEAAEKRLEAERARVEMARKTEEEAERKSEERKRLVEAEAEKARAEEEWKKSAEAREELQRKRLKAEDDERRTCEAQLAEQKKRAAENSSGNTHSGTHRSRAGECSPLCCHCIISFTVVPTIVFTLNLLPITDSVVLCWHHPAPHQ